MCVLDSYAHDFAFLWTCFSFPIAPDIKLSDTHESRFISQNESLILEEQVIFQRLTIEVHYAEPLEGYRPKMDLLWVLG